MAIYIDNEKTSEIPSKENYVFDDLSSQCNMANLFWNNDLWAPVINVNEQLNERLSCQLYFKKKYKESILNENIPVLKENLIPVSIENDGTVKKADLASNWYSYENKKWANAVILEDETIHYKTGEVIPEDNIESYFVWIPKYRYKLWDLGNYNGLSAIAANKVHEIEISFNATNTSDNVTGECTTPMTSGATGNCKVGDYMTHPSFISIPSTGFWVGKFETGYKGTIGSSNSYQPEKIVIKPNISDWRGIQVANAHLNSFNYERHLDSHMMKNTEWGAVAYLSHSKYGIKNKVRLNNRSDFKTGYTAIKTPTCDYATESTDCNTYCADDSCNAPYNTSIGYLGSTTGNISGIYDMSGGAWEYVMGVLQDERGLPVSGRNNLLNSGFNGTYSCPSCEVNASGTSKTDGILFPDARYYDSYIYETDGHTFQRRILGDATGELGPFASTSSWYSNYAWFVFKDLPFFARGGEGRQGVNSGIFAFGLDRGNASGTLTYRIILTPLN